MTAIALTIIIFAVFITGVVAGVTGVITVAVHRTERNQTLSLPAADPVIHTVPAGWPEPAPQEIVMNRICFHIRPAPIVAGLCRGETRS